MKKIHVLIAALCLSSSLFLTKQALAGPGTITSWTELDAIRNDLSGSYQLGVDLSSSTPDYTGIGDQWTPIGSEASPFTGIFDGGGHTISDLNIPASGTPPNRDQIGLFGETSVSSIIKNVGVINAEVSGRNWVGILVGKNGGTISKSFSSGLVSGRHYVGGLVGGNNNIYPKAISNCYSTASVSLNQDPPGGGADIGGLVGGQSGYIVNSYSSGAVASPSNGFGGGLLGVGHDDVVTASFWDIETSGQNLSWGGSGAMGISTAAMGATSTFANVGWDFDDIWIISNGYPHLRWENNFEDVIEIFSCQQLSDIRNNLSGKYSIMRDIACLNDTGPGGALYNGGEGFNPIGDRDNPFSGVINGNGHLIDGPYINRRLSDLVGIFSKTASSSIIRNLGVARANITGANSVGALIGQNESLNISKVYSSGSVAGEDGVGGLIGLNDGNLTDAYSTATTTGNILSGGLIGSNNGNITKSFSTGAVLGAGTRGGLVATGTAGLISKSFWDTESSGVATSAGGVGKNTEEMKTISTFTNDDWDFDNTWRIGTYPIKNNNYPWLVWEAPFEVDYSAGPNGTINGPSPQLVGFGAAALPVEATPETHYQFSQWSDGNTNPIRTENNIMGHVSLSAGFAIDPNTTFSVVYTAGTGGTITGVSSQSIKYNESGTLVTATVLPGYRFVGWDDGFAGNTRIDSNVASDMTIRALFELDRSGGGGGLPAPVTTGDGIRDVDVHTLSPLNLGSINKNGVNVITYINNENFFSALISSKQEEQNHKFKITDIDLLRKALTVVFYSEPKSLSLSMGETKYLDMDGDRIADISVRFSNVNVNKPELTIKSLISQATSDTSPREISLPTPDNQPIQTIIFARDLKPGMTGSDVKELQKYLNRNGFLVAKYGPGSLNNETSYFGRLTKAALIKFQNAKKISPTTGYLEAKTREIVNKK